MIFSRDGVKKLGRKKGNSIVSYISDIIYAPVICNYILESENGKDPM